HTDYYYRKDTREQLYKQALISDDGTDTEPYVNDVHIKNDGIDLSLEGISQLTSDLRLHVNLNFTTYNNEIVKIAEGEEYFETETRRFGTAIIRNEVGHPISSYYGFQIDCIRSEEHTSELQSRENLVCRLLLEKKKIII